MSEQVKKNEVVKQEMQNALAKVDKDIADQVFKRVSELENMGQLMFPKNYAVGNALKSAYLALQDVKDRNGKPALEVCTKVSIANALLDMVIQGLNPSKKQCYFIAYGTQLQMIRSYFGDQVTVKNAFKDNDVNIYPSIIYEGDEVEIEKDPITGRDRIISHKTKIENRDNQIKAAYATLVKDGKLVDQEIMTWKEIQIAWSKAKSKNTHNEFPQEMAARTVIRRLAKRYINTSDDANLFVVDSYNRTTHDEYENDFVDSQEELNNQVDAVANSEPLAVEVDYEEVNELIPEEEQDLDQPDF